MLLASRTLSLNLALVDVEAQDDPCRDKISSCNAGTTRVPEVQPPDCGDLQSGCNAGTQAAPEIQPPDCDFQSGCNAGTQAQPTKTQSRRADAVKRAIRRQMRQRRAAGR